MYEPRDYRHWVSDRDLVSFHVALRETDLLIRADRDLTDDALAAARRCRADLEAYISSHPHFAVSLEPVPVESSAPSLVKDMADAARRAGVGPMAAVAGAIAEQVGTALLALTEEVIVENGGDIYIVSSKVRSIGVYAGESGLTGRVAFVVRPEDTPLGICTSSGTVGHSLSFGEADAVTVFSPSTALADAAATSIANRVSSARDIAQALEYALTIEGLKGVAIIKDDKMGIQGDLTLADPARG
jgi:uncharacterized protein